MEAKHLLELKTIHKSFILDNGRHLKVLENINLTLDPNEVLVLLGQSGSGKSTCLRILAGLIEPSKGKVLLQGNLLDEPNPSLSLVFQSFALLPWLNIRDNVKLGLKSLNLSKKEISSRVKAVIDLVGLEGFEEAYPKELSGGMKQRVGFARALIMDRPILCLDEPFSALDVLTAESMRKEVINLWLSHRTKTQSIILVTHNILEAVSMGSRILIMSSNPGHIKYQLINNLPYPRDEVSSEFKNLVEHIHDLLTEAIMPDEGTLEMQPVEGAVEALPPVSVMEMIGLMELVMQDGGRKNAFSVAKKMMRDSLHVLIIARAAELLDLVETPKNFIVVTTLGKKFVAGDINERKKIIHNQMLKLKFMELFLEKLSEEKEHYISRQDAEELIHKWLPNENPEQVLHTFIQWGRFGEVVGYSDDAQEFYLPTVE